MVKEVSTLKKTMILTAVISAVLTFLFTVLCVIYKADVWETLAITFGTIFYHFAMRLLVGALVSAVLKGQADYTKPWYQQKKFEKKIYKFLKVKKWKAFMPTFNEDEFSLEQRSLEELASATCQAEIVHEIIVVLSFLPLLASLEFGVFYVFLATSVFAAGFDMMFVIMQRFNRPRILRLLKSKNK